MRIVFTLLLLSSAVAAVPAADATPDALVADLTGRDGKAASEARAKLVGLGPVAVPVLTQGLWDGSGTRAACLALLSRIGADAETVLPVLLKAVKSERAEEAYGAARLIGELGPEAASAVPALNNELPAADPILTALLADALGRVGPGAKDAVPTLKTKVMENKNAAPYRVQAAVATWRITRDPDAAKFLRDALEGPKGRARPHAALWRIEPSKETEDALAKQLKAEDPADVLEAAELLGKRSKETLPALLKLLKSEDRVARSAVVPLLAEFGAEAKDALETLQTIADGKRGRVDAVAAVYRIAPTPQAARALTDLLEEKDSALYAAEALKQLRPANQAVVIELLAALDSPDEQVRLACAVALWRIEKHARALPAAITCLRSADARVREQVAADLGSEFGADAKAAVPELVKRLFDLFAGVRSASAEALGRIGPGAADAAKPLLALLDGDEPAFVQSAACEALGLIHPTDKDDAIALLKKKLDHPAALVRVHAALALVHLGDKSGEAVAAAGLTARGHQARIPAAEAVWRLSKDGRAIPLLIRALEESNLDGTAGENERYMAARALGRVGKDAKDAAPELLRLVTHRDDALATAARTALKVIDPDALKK